MPLLRRLAKAGVAAGAAKAVANRASKRQGDRWAAQPEPAAGPPAGQPPAPDPMAQLNELADLHDRGALTDEEFSAQKAKLLA
jgi:hypothetical protein